MIVVSDTSPLNYLVLVDAVEVLAAIFGTVYAPGAVVDEFRDPASPGAVRAWAGATPDWLVVREPSRIDPALPAGLGKGEAAAISLASELAAERVLIDERQARRLAKHRGLVVVGTLGILDEAACRRLVDIDRVVASLKRTSFRASDDLYRAVIEDVRSRMGDGG